jgi:hypothetical protein
MKLCKDCKHHFDGHVYYRGYHIPITWGNCAHLVKDRDPVDGDVLDIKQLIDCREYRAEVSHIENKCGPDAKHFKRHWYSE